MLPVGRIIRTIPLTQTLLGVQAMAQGDGSLWVATSAFPHGSVLRIDPLTGRTIANISVGWAPGALLVEPNRVWVSDTIGDGSQADADQNHVIAIDVTSNTVVATDQVPVPAGLASAADSIWVVSPDGNAYSTVRRMSPVSGRVQQAIRIPEAGATQLVLAGGLLWTATLSESGQADVWGLDPRDGKLRSPFSVAGGVTFLLSDGQSLFVVGSPDIGSIARIDPSTGKQLAASSHYDGLQAIGLGAGWIWLCTTDGGLHRVALADLVDHGAPLHIAGSPAFVVASHTVWLMTDGGLVEIEPAASG